MAAKRESIPQKNAGDKWQRKEQCSLCEDAPATLRVTVTTLDGTMLDRTDVCRVCALQPLDDLGLTPGQ